MRSLHWPEPRQALAALAAAGCLILAACGGDSSSHPPPASPTASTSTAAEPTSGPAAEAAITANWKTVFNGKAPIPQRLALVQDGAQLAAFVQAQAKTSFGTAATGSTATVSAVTFRHHRRPRCTTGSLLLGTPLLKNQVGNAIYQNGIWKVAIASFCGLAYLEYPKGSPQAARCLPGASG